jgi:hypothetical protein
MARLMYDPPEVTCIECGGDGCELCGGTGHTQFDCGFCPHTRWCCMKTPGMCPSPQEAEIRIAYRMRNCMPKKKVRRARV